MESIFSKLTEDELVKIVAVSENVRFSPGDVIYTQDDEGESLYIVKQGLVSLVKVNDIGEDTEFTDVGEGSFLSELSILDGGPRVLTAIAISDVECFKITKMKLRLLKEYESKILLKFYLTIIKDMNQRLRRVNEEYVRIKEKLKKTEVV